MPALAGNPGQKVADVDTIGGDLAAVRRTDRPAFAVSLVESAVEFRFVVHEMSPCYANTKRERLSKSVTLCEIVRLARFWAAAAGNGETRKDLSLVFAANVRMMDARQRAA